MKAIQHMTNTDRAYLLANLFPDRLKEMTDFIKKEAEFFTENKALVYAQWNEKIINADLWYKLIADFEHRYAKNGTRLYRNKRTFRDQLFDGYDALFSIHALIHYTEQPECALKLKQAIHLLFGVQKLVLIDLKPTS
ncbi:hypothetical protein BBI01_01375 [Chryseobacterium artocarpi]|uniref:Uncharacterized protein n=1 Tax=Chryseobacterium artocarpi TaxID=1414727 RepID=A0A1B8ZZZ6_9FLAO|nr:hypothetical protein [Chryseobacterium artocarpi]OCA77142.1 hypothetical protein BBI01_01375 [Chryseobacterium artocarpi]